MPDISEPRHITYVRLDQIEHAARNPKTHAADQIARSIAHHGLGELPLRDDRTGRLVAGHGRHDQLVSMRSSGDTAPDGVLVDPDDGMWLMPVITGWSSRSDADAEAYLVASNQLTAVGGWDKSGLAEILSDLESADLLDLTGFTSSDLDLLTDVGKDTLPEPGDANTSDSQPARFGVIVECDSEAQQVDLLERLDVEGFNCRAML
jgi:hypothetical protein